MEEVGLSDVSSEQGDLFRFTEICRLIGDAQLPSSQVVESIRERLALSNRSVIGRHLSILQKIGLVTRRDQDLVLTSDGRVLLKIADTQQFKTDVLPGEERILYFRALILRASWQIRQMLRTFRGEERQDRTTAVLDYFQEYLDHGPSIWNRTSIERALISSDATGRLSSNLRNKFACVQKWLMQLGLLHSEHGHVMLTESGNHLLKALERNDSSLPSSVFGMASELLPDSRVVGFCMKEEAHVDAALSLLHEASRLFQRKIDMVDYRSAALFTSIRLLSHNGLVLEEDDFYSLIRHLWTEARVKQVFSGRNGKPAYLTLETLVGD